MLERFTGDARGVVTGARESALRLGHDWIGCEHLLLALATTGGEVGTLLRDRGITPERVRWEAVRLAGAGRGASLSDVLDRDALAAIGIDLDAVRGQGRGGVRPGLLHRGSGPGTAPAALGAPPGAPGPPGPVGSGPGRRRRDACGRPAGDARTGQGERRRPEARPVHPPGQEVPDARGR